MDIVGYSDRLSVMPGDVIRFMVSTAAPTYEVAIVRLIHGDTNPTGPGFKEEVLRTPVDGTYPGREQPYRAGSHVLVPDSPALPPSRGMSEAHPAGPEYQKQSRRSGYARDSR